MYTLGYSFRPWSEPQAIADGSAILRYVNETAAEYGITNNIRFGHHVQRASWSTAEARWTVETERTDTAKPCRFTCNFLFMCSGYYNYDRGYTPEFAGADTFQGQIVHPQRWTDDIEYADKRVVVIGSGATAVTLVPEMAKTAAHVTMLQRSPTYIVAMPSEDHVANLLRRFLPNSLVYSLTRWRNVILGACFFWFCRRHPERAKALSWAASEPPSAPTMMSSSISGPTTTPGSSACVWHPTTISLPRSRPVGLRSSPTTSPASPNGAFGCIRAQRSRPI